MLAQILGRVGANLRVTLLEGGQHACPRSLRVDRHLFMVKEKPK